MKSRWRILVVAGSAYGESVGARLRAANHTVDVTRCRAEALSLASAGQYSVYLIDLEKQETDGAGIVAELRRLQPEASVILTARGAGMAEEDFADLTHTVLSGSPSVVNLEAMEKVVISATLEHTGGNIRGSAAMLGIDRSTLYEKIKKYEIPRMKRRNQNDHNTLP